MAKWENIVTDWKIEYKTVWNYEIKVDKDGYVYINGNKYNAFENLKPMEKRGLYDFYIDNHIDIPEGISKDSPCYKQFIKEKEMGI